MLKFSVLYLIKQKSFVPKKYDLGHSQYKKKALFPDPIFSNDFGLTLPFQLEQLRGGQFTPTLVLIAPSPPWDFQTFLRPLSMHANAVFIRAFEKEWENSSVKPKKMCPNS